MPLENGLFRELIGPAKHGAHLNFLYGIVVEEALQQANIEEVAKAQQAMGAREESIEDEAFRRLYDAPGIELRKEYRRDLRRSGASGRSSLDDQKGFTYWLFKRRMRREAIRPALQAIRAKASSCWSASSLPSGNGRRANRHELQRHPFSFANVQRFRPSG